MRNTANQTASPKRKHSRENKGSIESRKQVVLAVALVPLGVEVIRLIEELLKMFKQ